MADDHDMEKETETLLEEIFCSEESTDVEPFSWTSWKDGKADYKPFSLQFKECNTNGTAFLEKCLMCGHELIMCRRYGGQCRSNKCRHTRIRKVEEL